MRVPLRRPRRVPHPRGHGLLSQSFENASGLLFDAIALGKATLGVDLAPVARVRRAGVTVHRPRVRLHVRLLVAQAGHSADVTVALRGRFKDGGLVLAEILQALRARVHVHRIGLLVRLLLLHVQLLWILLRMSAAKHALFALVLGGVARHGCTLALVLNHACHLPRHGDHL